VNKEDSDSDYVKICACWVSVNLCYAPTLSKEV